MARLFLGFFQVLPVVLSAVEIRALYLQETEQVHAAEPAPSAKIRHD